MSDAGRRRLLRAAIPGEAIALDMDGHVLEIDPFAAEAEHATGDAEAIVGAARGEAVQLVQRAAEQAAAIQHEAYQEGRAEGERDGRAAARAEVADALLLVQRAAADAKGVRDRLIAGLEREIVELVIDATRAVLGEQARVDPSMVIDTVERALRRAGSQNVVRVRMHPDTLDVVAAHVAERRIEGAADWELHADGSIDVGGCVIDTTGGEIDARLDSQLAEVAAALRDSAVTPDVDLPEEVRRAA